MFSKGAEFEPNIIDIDENRFNLGADLKYFYGNIKATDIKHTQELLGKPVMVSVFADTNHAMNIITITCMS